MQLIPKKSLGQHFLNSRHVLEQIIQAADIKVGEIILEIGPGTGFLTDALLHAKANVVAIEKDDRAFELLQEKYSDQISNKKLKLIKGDILDLKIADLLKSSDFPAPTTENESKIADYSIVANIPYYITGAILQKFLEEDYRPKRMVLLVQKEVADRIVAHDNKESILSVSVKAFGSPKIAQRVPRGAFTPPPSVESAILCIENINNERFTSNNVEISTFFKIVKSGFAHKRKFLMRNLEQAMEASKIKDIWQRLNLNEKIRAEDLKLEDWFRISVLIK
ncbi:MAG: 16S rRNA (adenine(1518)-N(6)/adenine(1519)-N(6))-dimethyltransferase RsmA [Candidatus Paceibacterota bacterium]|jgi:16S rRNA (adenine1518-N6/adenine1519-N6)-dimethyltransferase